MADLKGDLLDRHVIADVEDAAEVISDKWSASDPRRTYNIVNSMLGYTKRIGIRRRTGRVGRRFANSSARARTDDLKPQKQIHIHQDTQSLRHEYGNQPEPVLW